MVFLTADAFGVLPPIARLTPEQAAYHFLSGYTAKVAGTERGVTEPSRDLLGLLRRAVHVAPPARSTADLLERPAAAERRAASGCINTGWTGGGYGVGQAHRHRHDPAPARRGRLPGELEQCRDADRAAVRHAGAAAGRTGYVPAPSIRAPAGPTSTAYDAGRGKAPGPVRARTTASSRLCRWRRSNAAAPSPRPSTSSG